MADSLNFINDESKERIPSQPYILTVDLNITDELTQSIYEKLNISEEERGGIKYNSFLKDSSRIATIRSDE